LIIDRGPFLFTLILLFIDTLSDSEEYAKLVIVQILRKYPQDDSWICIIRTKIFCND